MASDVRALAIAAAGFAAFVNLYSPQALLPELAREFGVGAGEISALMTSTTAAIALTAPFTGALADVLGRKRLITAAAFAVAVPTLLMAFAAKRAATRLLALPAGPVVASYSYRDDRVCRG
jgi:YNFM family putative membrane transporter